MGEPSCPYHLSWLKSQEGPDSQAAGGWHGSSPHLLALLPGLHAGDEGVALVPAVVLVGVVQGHAHTLVLVPFIPHIPPLDGVLDPLLLCAEATRSTPAFGRKRGEWLQPRKADIW